MKKWLFRLNDSIWFTPTLLTFFSALLAIATVLIDTLYIGELVEELPYFMLTSVDLAQTILGTIAGALLTMTTITFSTIMVVLTTYSSQFSPRVLKNFITDKVTMRVLGIFMGGFVYSILSLLFMREASIDHNVISATVGVLFAVICLAFFAYFIHSVATSIQVSNLVADLAADTHAVFEKNEKLYSRYSYVRLAEKPVHKVEETHLISSDAVGYIRMIEIDALMKCASSNKVKLEILKPIGAFVTKNEPLLRVEGTEKVLDSVADYFVIGPEPSSDQDVSYAIQKIVEIALRAISPGINDPNTAILCIRHLSGLLPQALEEAASYVQFSSEEGSVLLPHKSNRDLLFQTFSGLAHYGREDVNVLLACLEALQVIQDEALRNEMVHYMIGHFNEDCLEPFDQERVTKFVQVN